jgi:peptidyl-prolyl cis-trans isomerase C
MPLTVNGQTIPEAAIVFELDRLIRFYSEHLPPEEVRAQVPALRAKARDQAIGAKLLLDEAARLDIQVPAPDVDARLRRMAEQAGGLARLEERLRKQGHTIEGVRAGIESGRRVDLLVERLTADLPDPTEAEMEAHFRDHAAEYRRPERAQAQHILIRPASNSESDRREARGKAESLRQKVLDGADFAELAAAHSQCPSGKRAGGSLGWISRGMLVPAFDDAVFSMEVGTISETIATPLGFHVIRKTGHEPAAPAEFADVRDQVRDFLRHARRGQLISACVNELKTKASIEDTPDE